MSNKKHDIQQIFKNMNQGATSQMYSTEDWLELVAEEGGDKLQDAEEQVEDDDDDDGNERTKD